MPTDATGLKPNFSSVNLTLGLCLALRTRETSGFRVVPLSRPLDVCPSSRSGFVFRITGSATGGCKERLPKYGTQVSDSVPLAHKLKSDTTTVMTKVRLTSTLYSLRLDRCRGLRLSSQVRKRPSGTKTSLLKNLIVNYVSRRRISIRDVGGVDFSIVTIIPGRRLLAGRSENILPRT